MIKIGRSRGFKFFRLLVKIMIGSSVFEQQKRTGSEKLIASPPAKRTYVISKTLMSNIFLNILND